MKKIRLITFIAIGVLFSNCNKNIEKICFKNYPKKSEFDRKPIFSIDSTITSNSDCLYYTGTLIILKDSSTSFQEVFRFKNNKILVTLLDPKSNEFTLFDLNSKLKQKSKIEIQYLNKKKIFTCTLEKRIITKENLEVNIFRIDKWVKYYSASFDAVLFVTKEHGVIGSYLTDIEEDGTKTMIAPAGEILQEYIDYSKYETRRLL